MVDEQGYGRKKRSRRMGVRSAVMASLEAGRFAYDVKWSDGKKGPVRRMADLGTILRYGMQYGMTSRNKAKPIMNIEKLVDQWVEAVVTMCTCHDKDDYDAADAKADELLGPLLTAPVKQVREFYRKLYDRLRSDKRVPMLVWMGFEAWGAVCVDGAPDEGIKRLKLKLAGEIAELVEGQVQDQIPEAIKRALAWRDPGVLKEVKEELQKGGKAKLTGRQSCLFLGVKRGKKEIEVML